MSNPQTLDNIYTNCNAGVLDIYLVYGDAVEVVVCGADLVLGVHWGDVKYSLMLYTWLKADIVARLVGLGSGLTSGSPWLCKQDSEVLRLSDN